MTGKPECIPETEHLPPRFAPDLRDRLIGSSLPRISRATPHLPCNDDLPRASNRALKHAVHKGTFQFHRRRLERKGERSMSQTQTMTTDQATFLLHDLYMGTLKTESRTTKKILEAVPANKVEYKPDPASRSAIELARQIASWYEERYAKNFEALAKVSGDQLVKIVDFRGMFQWPAVKFVMFGLHHTIHHRGQLASYLRCMGAKVPSIYGESYDDAQARKAAQA